MTQEISNEDIFNSLNPSKILIGTLTQIKEVTIPVNFFLDVPDSQVAVTLSEDGSSFIFNLRDKNASE